MRRQSSIRLLAALGFGIICFLGCSSTDKTSKQTQDQKPAQESTEQKASPEAADQKASQTASKNTTPVADTDSSKHALPPHLRFSPAVLIAKPDSLGFVTARIYIHNDGGGVLMMSDVKGSCGCAGVSVQRNKVTSTDSGMIYIQVNTKAFAEASNNVDFTVKSNADNSPSVFRAVININK